MRKDSSELARIPLADWIDAVRQEIQTAQARYEGFSQSNPDNTLGFLIDELTLEASVEAEVEGNGKMEIKVYVLSAGGGVTRKVGTTQKISIKLKPIEAMSVGSPEEIDEFRRQ